MNTASRPSPLAKITSAILTLADAWLVFWLLPPLMLLLTIGTLAQRWLGLYRAHEMFFSSFILWAGPIPLPGGFTLLSLLSFALLIKFLFKSDWSWTKSGIILTHLGVLTLLIGGLATALYAKESFMIIPEGQETSYIYDYNDRSLVIFEDGRERTRLPYEKIEHWNKTPLPFSLSVVMSCTNCTIEKPESPPEDARSMAAFMQLKPAPEEKEPEANLSGAMLTLTNTGSQETDGTYIVFDGMPKPITFTKDGHEYTIVFGKDQTQLPFSLKLNNFKKEVYNGTDKARAYSSEIELKDGALSWPVTISMNNPLRYHGYTFFQSSFEEREDGSATILAVVENKGRLLPYIGTALLGAGLLLHLLIALFTGARR